MSNKGEEIIVAEDLSFRYRRTERKALDGICVTAHRGEFIGVTGPAGAGKTTFLRCINGVIPHYYGGDLSGGVTVAGVRVADATFKDLASRVGTVFEDPDFQMVSITVEEEVAFGPENLGIPREEIASRVRACLEQTRISELRERAISTLSGGQKQRVAISAVLSMLPDVLLLDEPTSELDPIGTQEVFTALRDLNREHGITVICVSQKMERLVETADRILGLTDGRIALDAAPAEACLRWEELEGVGVRMPQVPDFMISLLQELGRGVACSDVPLTVQEAIPRLRGLMNGREDTT